jgi:hypothetical protein
MISPIIVVGGITIRPANGKRAIVDDLTRTDALRKGVGIEERLERRTDLAFDGSSVYSLLRERTPGLLDAFSCRPERQPQFPQPLAIRNSRTIRAQMQLRLQVQRQKFRSL